MSNMTTLPTPLYTFVLIMLVVLVYILKQESGKIVRKPSPSYQVKVIKTLTKSMKKMSKELFLKKTKDLKTRAGSIIDDADVWKPLQVKRIDVVQSRTIVYNRINKAGSSTMIGNTQDYAYRVEKSWQRGQQADGTFSHSRHFSEH